MTTLTHNNYTSVTTPHNEVTVDAHDGLFTRFLNWADGQERYRFGWLAAALATHGCALTPLTLFAIILSGNIMALWVVALACMGATLVTNLAAMPTKITIPVFLASIVIDLAVIISCICAGFDITGTYI
ncbi:hypothetical protein [Flaviaesturariibacter amylovorans]|uniref:Uncharacterized protein n=1 Tax=Flaviaesturariibacter amylovorans TaxID=1084520 RepID=A0ABP8GWL2_9BACT